MSVIRWQEPTPQGRGKKPGSSILDDDWARAVAAELREHPKRWAVIWQAPCIAEASNVALRIAASHAAFRLFDAACRKEADGVYLVYARYVGEDGAR